MYNPCKQNLKLPAKKIPFRFGKLPLGIIMMKALGDRLKLYFQFLLLNVKQRSQKSLSAMNMQNIAKSNKIWQFFTKHNWILHSIFKGA